MKRNASLQKFLALLLSLLLTLSLSVTAFAEEMDPSADPSAESSAVQEPEEPTEPEGTEANTPDVLEAETPDTSAAPEADVPEVEAPVEEPTPEVEPEQEPEPEEKPETGPVAEVQALIDALPGAEEITADNAEDVAAQLTAIDEAKVELTDEQRDALDIEKYIAAAEALGATYDAQPLADPVAKIGEQGYESIAAAIDAVAPKKTTTIELVKSTNEDVVIPADKKVILKIPAGVTVTNATNGHTITNNGTLTINGSGTLKNTASGSGVVFNTVGAIAYLNGCTFEGDSWYVLKNLGTMTIKGATIQQNDAGSSAIDNGWYGNVTNDCGVTHADGNIAKLTIDKGNFSGGMNTVKNDDYGSLTINNGTFENTNGPTVLNWNKATINGGTFTVNDSAKSVIANGYIAGGADEGELTITGGAFTASNGGAGALFGYGIGSGKGGTFTITNGTFNGTIAADDSYPCKPVVSGGLFTDDKVGDYASAGNIGVEAEGGKFTVGVDRSEGSPAVAETNGVGYTDINTAFDVAISTGGGTVTLLQDNLSVDLININRSVDLTLDLNGKTLNLTGTYKDPDYKCAMRVAMGNVVIKNGTIRDERSYDDPSLTGLQTICVSRVSGQPTLTLEGVEVVTCCPQSGSNNILYAEKGGQIVLNAGTVIHDDLRDNGGSCFGAVICGGNPRVIGGLTVNGSTIDTKGCCISGNGNSHGTVITIADGSKVISSESLGIYHPQDGTLNVNGGTISGITGIEMRAGTLNVTKGSKIEATAAKLEVAEGGNGNGSTTVGAGIAVAQHTTQKKITINISDGVISGAAALYESNPNNVVVPDTEKMEINITGGDFTAPAGKEAVHSDNQTNFISGGTFSSKVPEEYCAATYEPTDVDINGNYTVCNHHNVKEEPATAPTCTEKGNIAYWHCQTCGRYFSNQDCTAEIKEDATVLAAIGHKYGEPQFIWAVDYSSATATRTCKNDATHVISIVATVTSQTTPATTTKAGQTVYTATVTVDGTIYTDTKTLTIPVLTPTHTHSYGKDWKSDATGHWQVCSCGAKSPVEAHTFQWVTDKEPTATEQGSKHEVCTVCGAKGAAATIPATGNATQPKPTTPATPTTSTKTNTTTPKTGDNSLILICAVGLVIASGGLTGVIVYSRKRQSR